MQNKSIRKIFAWLSEPVYLYTLTGILVLYCLVNKIWWGLALLVIHLFWGGKIRGWILEKIKKGQSP